MLPLKLYPRHLIKYPTQQRPINKSVLKPLPLKTIQLVKKLLSFKVCSEFLLICKKYIWLLLKSSQGN